MNTHIRPVQLHPERSIPELAPITIKVADVADETLFPNIVEARRHAAAFRDDPVGRDFGLVENG